MREPLYARQRQPERWRRNQEGSVTINPWYVRRSVSGWHPLAVYGSRKRITVHCANGWPLRHDLRRWTTDGSVVQLRTRGTTVPLYTDCYPPYTDCYPPYTDCYPPYTDHYRPYTDRYRPYTDQYRPAVHCCTSVWILVNPYTAERPWDTGQSVQFGVLWPNCTKPWVIGHSSDHRQTCRTVLDRYTRLTVPYSYGPLR